MSDDWQDIYTGNEEVAKRAAEELKRKMSERITQQELINLFGDRIPIEAAMLLSSETDIDSLRKQLADMADKSIANQLRERLEAIVQAGADWFDEPNVKLNLYSPNEILTMVRNLERMICYLESGAGY